VAQEERMLTRLKERQHMVDGRDMYSFQDLRDLQAGALFPYLESVLMMLKQHALEKLAARDRFKESGVATFKLRCAKGLNCKVKKLDFELALLGSELQRQVAELVNTPADQLKVIVGGQVV
jgi:hypothetical protein